MQHIRHGGNQEEDAGHEGGEGQRHGPGRCLRGVFQGSEDQSREGAGGSG